MELYLLSLIILFSQALEVILGFGGTFFALILFKFFNLPGENIWILIPLNIIINIYVLTLERKKLEPLYSIKKVLPELLIGYGVAYYLRDYVSLKTFYIVQGILLIMLVLFPFLKKINIKSPLSSFVHNFTSGLAYSTIGAGGPFISLYFTHLFSEKGKIRGNLALIWLITNLMVVGDKFDLMRKINLTFYEIFYLFVLILVSGKMGNFFHKKIPNKIHQNLSLFILVIMGLCLISLH